MVSFKLCSIIKSTIIQHALHPCCTNTASTVTDTTDNDVEACIQKYSECIIFMSYRTTNIS